MSAAVWSMVMTSFCFNQISDLNETIHFSETLDQNSSGPMSHQLRSFSLFLEEQSPLSQRKTLLNNVQFWLEVKKFNVSSISLGEEFLIDLCSLLFRVCMRVVLTCMCC